jgi:hypothetical protein
MGTLRGPIPCSREEARCAQSCPRYGRCLSPNPGGSRSASCSPAGSSSAGPACSPGRTRPAAGSCSTMCAAAARPWSLWNDRPRRPAGPDFHFAGQRASCRTGPVGMRSGRGTGIRACSCGLPGRAEAGRRLGPATGRDSDRPADRGPLVHRLARPVLAADLAPARCRPGPGDRDPLGLVLARHGAATVLGPVPPRGALVLARSSGPRGNATPDGWLGHSARADHRGAGERAAARVSGLALRSRRLGRLKPDRRAHGCSAAGLLLELVDLL